MFDMMEKQVVATLRSILKVQGETFFPLPPIVPLSERDEKSSLGHISGKKCKKIGRENEAMKRKAG